MGFRGQGAIEYLMVGDGRRPLAHSAASNAPETRLLGVRAQGAMEYLMSYGWAILLVMVVGAEMWNLGIFNLGSGSVTSSGFTFIKPFTATCEFGNVAGYQGVQLAGFTCQFINLSPNTIGISNIDVLVNNGTCDSNYVSTNTTSARMVFPIIWKFCHSWNPDCQYNCFLTPTRGCSPKFGLPVPSNTQFTLRTGDTDGDTSCVDMGSGSGSYEIQVTISYNEQIGGQMIAKIESGTIHITQ